MYALFFFCASWLVFIASFLSFYTDLGKLGVTIFSLYFLGNGVDLLCLKLWWLFISSFSLSSTSWEPMSESVRVGFPLIKGISLGKSAPPLWSTRQNLLLRLKYGHCKGSMVLMLTLPYWAFSWKLHRFSFTCVNSESLWTPFLLFHISPLIEEFDFGGLFLRGCRWPTLRLI